jgi:FixJ family two-component response regulator
MKPSQNCVYVVEDDASMRNAIKNLLRSVGLEPQLFVTAQEFLDAKRPDLPSCLLLAMEHADL